MAAELHEASEPDDIEEEDVDLDLDAEGEQLRQERVGNPTRVRINGSVILIRHAGAWPASAMRAAGVADWDAWAQEVIDDPVQFQDWVDANLENYQIEAIFQKCGDKARITMGKSQRRSGQQRRTRKR
jgi:hypothetical protein